MSQIVEFEKPAKPHDTTSPDFITFAISPLPAGPILNQMQIPTHTRPTNAVGIGSNIKPTTMPIKILK